LIAGSFRFLGGYCFAFYKPKFFLEIYPKYATQFGLIDGILAGVLGFISTLAGGILSDKYHKKSYWTKAIISILSGALATPAIVLCFLC